MATTKTFWILSGSTESGDDFSYLFDGKLTAEQANAFLAKAMPIEYEEVGFTHWSIEQTAVERVADITPAMVKRMHALVKKPKS